MDYIPVRRWAGNQLYTLAAIMAHNLTREIRNLVLAQIGLYGLKRKRAFTAPW
jgi:hypothetical protein